LSLAAKPNAYHKVCRGLEHGFMPILKNFE